MNRIDQALRRVARDLNDAGVPFALVGGLAVSSWVEPRFTRDVDLAVAVASDDEAQQLILRLTRLGYQIVALVEQEAVHRLATVRLMPPGPTTEGLLVDLLFASSGVEPELVQGATSLELLPGLAIRVARAEHLLALKILSLDDRRRPQDRVDVLALLPILNEPQLDDARQLLALIERRGYHRGKNLVAELDALR
ncbi:MAG: nucleotidyl transferase AbiEii/AbiGii toxin family protein [Planctomycetota bacterium]